MIPVDLNRLREAREGTDGIDYDDYDAIHDKTAQAVLDAPRIWWCERFMMGNVAPEWCEKHPDAGCRFVSLVAVKGES